MRPQSSVVPITAGCFGGRSASPVGDCQAARSLVQQGIYERSVRRAAHLASYPPRAPSQPKFGVDGLDVAHPGSLGCATPKPPGWCQIEWNSDSTWVKCERRRTEAGRSGIVSSRARSPRARAVGIRNGQMSWGDVAFDADLVANVLGDLAGLVGSEELFRLHDRTARSFVQGCVVA